MTPNKHYSEQYSIDVFRKETEQLIEGIHRCQKIENVRDTLVRRCTGIFGSHFHEKYPAAHELIRMRDCSLALMNVFSERSESRTGFSLVQSVWDIARGRQRDDLQPGFFAELINWVRGLEGRAGFQFLIKYREENGLSGREKAIARSNELDRIWESVEDRLSAYPDGLSSVLLSDREQRKHCICAALRANAADWEDWKWQIKNVIIDPEILRRLIPLDDSEYNSIKKALQGRIPFGITPYYLSLMDGESGSRDRAIRAQVLPPKDYVNQMQLHRESRNHSFDFMLEFDTSPVDHVTRRYPAVVILKPVSTCPQICVYCQRNWEIEEVMASNSFVCPSEINPALEWIERHPFVREVLVTGGDPLIMSDRKLESLLKKLANIPHIDLIRIGTRTPVTLPMRITEDLAEMLGQLRELGRRDIAVITHIEHPLEITIETALAVDRLRRRGIGVYNQQVFTFYVSRRFESTRLRILLRRIGIDPYYTFMPKGKEETNAYRVPLARLLQEQKEEVRLVPGLRRTDEAVFNVPGLGKNYLRASQHRDLLTVLPDGSRVYEFHPWEMNILKSETYLYKDIAIIDYLDRLAEIGENPEDYDSIWFYI